MHFSNKISKVFKRNYFDKPVGDLSILVLAYFSQSFTALATLISRTSLVKLCVTAAVIKQEVN